MVRLLISQLLFLVTFSAFSQFTDSLKVRVGSIATLASGEYQPFWISSNRFGTISSQQADISTGLLFSNTHSFPLGRKQGSSQKPTGKAIFLNYGFDLYNNNHFQTTFLKEGFIKIGFNKIQLRGGRYESTTGEADSELSSGSFGISSNALPIPKIGIAITEFQEVPFSKGLLHFKGNFEHGWLGNSKWVKQAFLHEKSFYLKVGSQSLNVHAGIFHFAQWGGKHMSGQAPDRFKDFARIVLGKSGDIKDSVYHRGPVDNANAVGNHLLIPDFGLNFKVKGSLFKIYTQTIFEKGTADSANQRDNIEGLKILGKDRIVGLSWENKGASLLSKIVLEGIYTRHQGGSTIYKGRDNYYNNATYLDGWEYKERIIGTPLFINKKSASYYSIKNNIPDYSWNIVSNRLLGLHLALKGNFSSKWSFKTLTTYLQHYGNYYNDEVFSPPLTQASLLFENSYLMKENINITLGIAHDFGDLMKNTGSILKIEWTLANPNY